MYKRVNGPCARRPALALGARAKPVLPHRVRPFDHRHSTTNTRAMSGDTSGSSTVETPDGFVRAHIHEVAYAADASVQAGSGTRVILLRCEDSERYVPVWVVDDVAAPLEEALANQQRVFDRPMTYDLLKNSIESLGGKISHVAMTTCDRSIFHARIYVIKDGDAAPLDIDARPSDAFNLATRANAPIFVNKEIVDKQGQDIEKIHMKRKGEVAANPAAEPEQEQKSTATESHAVPARAAPLPTGLQQSTREALLRLRDPSAELRVSLGIAVAEERYEDAARLHSMSVHTLVNDRAVSLAVAMEAAYANHNYNEAASYYNALVALLERRERGEHETERESKQTQE